MADGGIGEAALYSAVIGGGTAAATGGDPMRGALMGGLTGGAMSGLGGLMGGAAAAPAADVAAGGAGAGAPAGISALDAGAANMQAVNAANAADAAGTAGASANAGDLMNSQEPGWATQTASNTTAPQGMGAGVAKTPLGSFISNSRPLSGMQLALTGGGAGLAEGMRAERDRFKMPTPETYSGPLSRIKYDPSTYTPYRYHSYAGGGPVEQMSNQNAVGANTGYPMANMHTAAYATPYQTPVSQNVISGDQDTRVDPYTGEEKLARGGIAALGGYSDGGQLLRGPGDGVSDSIPATIANKQPARLADGEFVVPARAVSELGNGSTEAGARQLYSMLDRIQQGRAKTVGKGKIAKDSRAAKHLPA
jgi:hypothetical protein